MALIASNCSDDTTWTDSEGFDCKFYTPFSESLVFPNRYSDSTIQKGPSTLKVCEEAHLFANGGMDATSACCLCKWASFHGQRMGMGDNLHEVDGEKTWCHYRIESGEKWFQLPMTIPNLPSYTYSRYPDGHFNFLWGTEDGSCVGPKFGNGPYSEVQYVDQATCRALCDADPACTGYKHGPRSLLNQEKTNCCLEHCNPPGVNGPARPCSCWSSPAYNYQDAKWSGPLGWTHYQKEIGGPHTKSGSGSSLVLARVMVSSSHASKGGGAVAVLATGPHASVETIDFRETLVSNCSASFGGGGMLALSMLHGNIGLVNLFSTNISDCTAGSMASGNQAKAFGGGLCILALENARIHTVNIGQLNVLRCLAASGAGGVLVWADTRAIVGPVSVQDTHVKSCNSSSAGGIVVASEYDGFFRGDVVFQGLLVENCHAQNSPWYSGQNFPDSRLGQEGKLSPENGGLRISGTIVGDVQVSDAVIQKCSAMSIDGRGGGILIGEIKKQPFRISEIEWTHSPSLMQNLRLRRVLVQDCAAYIGGGIFTTSVSGGLGGVSIQDTVVTRNTAIMAGGLGVFSHEVSVGPNVTISLNEAYGGGAGVMLYAAKMIAGVSIVKTFKALDLDNNMQLNQTEGKYWKKTQHLTEKASGGIRLEEFRASVQPCDQLKCRGLYMEDFHGVKLPCWGNPEDDIGGFGAAFDCAEGFTSKKTGKMMMGSNGRNYEEYTCCVLESNMQFDPDEVEQCDDSKCRSPDSQAGYNCWAGNGESFDCAQGFMAKKTRSTFNVEGSSWQEYTCCTKRASDTRVEIKNNRASGTLGISPAGWIEKLGHASFEFNTVNVSGHGGGILLYSTTKSGHSRDASSELVLLSGTSIQGNIAGLGGGIAMATEFPSGLVFSPSGQVTAAGDVTLADNYAVLNDNAINMKVLLPTFTIDGGDFDTPWGDGGGIWALDSASVSLLSGIIIRGNHAQNGGAICLRRSSLLTTLAAQFDQNMASVNGGAISAVQDSIVSADSTRFFGNWANNSGGALAGELGSRVNLMNCVLQQNHALSSGGGLASADDASISLISCNVVGNTAQNDGGGILVAGDSHMKMMGGQISSNLAARFGAGIALLDSASLTFWGSEQIKMKNNTAFLEGGAIFISSAGEAKFDSAMIHITKNTAKRGGGVCFVSKMVLIGGSTTKIEMNQASEMGGGLFGYSPNADAVVSDTHDLKIIANIAGSKGGGIALDSLAMLRIKPGACPCKASLLGDGVCNIDCARRECNWDMGDCDAKFIDAGKHALLPCDRTICQLAQAQSQTCYSSCMTAQCEWSNGGCRDEKFELATCPLFDATVLASLEAFAGEVSFVEGGSLDGYGRCSKYSCDDATVSTVNVDAPGSPEAPCSDTCNCQYFTGAKSGTFTSGTRIHEANSNCRWIISSRESSNAIHTNISTNPTMAAPDNVKILLTLSQMLEFEPVGSGTITVNECEDISWEGSGIRSGMTFYDAKTLCQSKGTVLYMDQDTLDLHTMDCPVWIGATESEDIPGSYVYLDGSEYNLGWSTPDGLPEPKDGISSMCAVYWPAYGKHAVPCQFSMGNICADPVAYCKDGQVLGAPPVVPVCMQPRIVSQISGYADPSVQYKSFTGIMEIVLETKSSHHGFEANWTFRAQDGIANRQKKCIAIQKKSDMTKNPGWGYCSDKKRLPSSGLLYNQTRFENIVQRDISTLLRLHPGCGSRPLELTNNVAGSFGGGLFLGDCDKSYELSNTCWLLKSNARRLPAMQIIFRGNHAGLAGGGLFINCALISHTCDTVFNAKLGLPMSGADGKVFLIGGNTADGYGDNIAQAPAFLSTRNVVHQYVPGRVRDVLQFAVEVADERTQHVKGSKAIGNPYRISLSICPPHIKISSCSSSEQLQEETIFKLDTTAAWTDVATFSIYVQQCLVGFSHISVHVSLDDGSALNVGTLHSLFLAQCLPCGLGESRVENTDTLGRAVWMCKSCGADEYILDNNDPAVECQRCAKGAICDGDQLRGKVNGSDWRRKGRHMRLNSCPAGYILVRDEAIPEADECVKCPRGSYSVLEARYPNAGDPSPGKLVVPTASSAVSLCVPCNLRKSSCAGGADVSPKKGYWRPSVTKFHDRRQTAQSDTAEVELIPCIPASRCLGGGNCAEGMYGPVCGLCQDGFAMGSDDLCIACPKSKSVSFRIGIGVVGSFIFFTFYYTIVLRPFFKDDSDSDPEGSESQSCQILPRSMSAFCEASGIDRLLKLHGVQLILRPLRYVLKKMWERSIFAVSSFLQNSGAEVIKVIISFLQVSGTFLSNYSIKWPVHVESFLKFALAFSVRLKAMPGNVACALTGITYFQLQLLYLLVPMALIVVLSFPALYITIRGHQHPKYEAVMKTWAHVVTFLLFLLYPVITGPALEVFDCVNIGNGEMRLKGMLSDVCPLSSPSSTVFVLGTILVLIYPIGILLIFYSLLVHYRVPEMAKHRIDEAHVQCLINFYQKIQADTLAVKIAMEFGGAASVASVNAGGWETSVSSESEDLFKARVNLLYDKATNNGKKDLNAARLCQYVHNLGIRGAHEEQLEKLFCAFDDDGNGQLDRDEFEKLIREVSEHCHLFSGTEGLKELSKVQLRTLVMFNFDQVAPKFDDETGITKSVKVYVMEQEKIIKRTKTLKRLQKLSTTRGPSEGTSNEGFARAASVQSTKSFTSRISALTDAGEDEDGIPFVPPEIDLEDMDALRTWVCHKAHSLARSGVIAVPTVGWEGRNSEIDAMARISFIFSAYKVKYWYYELLEMIRKLLMVGCMVMIYPNLPQQFAIGLLITCIWLVLGLRLQPWAHPTLNALNFFSLSFQAFMLFAGLVKKVSDYTEDASARTTATMEALQVTLTIMVVVIPAGILFAESSTNPITLLIAKTRSLLTCVSRIGFWGRQPCGNSFDDGMGNVCKNTPPGAPTNKCPRGPLTNSSDPVVKVGPTMSQTNESTSAPTQTSDGDNPDSDQVQIRALQVRHSKPRPGQTFMLQGTSPNDTQVKKYMHPVLYYSVN